MKHFIQYDGFSLEKKKSPEVTFLNFLKQFIIETILIVAALTLLVDVAIGQTYPTGFNEVQIASGIQSPTVMAFSPDGRLFIAQQTGELKIVKNGALLPTPFISLSVNSSGERGLLGIAFDPNFANNNYIYLYYTLSSGANNRISRFTANGDVVVPGSEVVIKDLDPLSAATNHNGGTMQFGPDGKLYIGVGENANSANSQNLDTYLGKILRLNSDGTIPSGNPFTSGTIQRQSIWSYGLRNPYTITFQPGTGRLFVNDVGENSWEEINDATTSGNNYGWPAAEGNSNDPAYTNPVYYYGHGSGSGLGCAITGGTFFNPASTDYPIGYQGNYFYLDYCGNWIDMLSFNGLIVTRTNFASSVASSPVGLITGPDGNLYFLSRDNSAVYKITYTNSNGPSINSQPQNVSVFEGSSASFSVTATGAGTLTYQWLKNNNPINNTNSSTFSIASTTMNDTGAYKVTVTNAFGTTTSNDAFLTVNAANQHPTATINTPVVGSTYAGGDVISFSGSGTDPEDGNLGASAFEWYVLFHHDNHVHPGPTAGSGIASGTFVIPNMGETSSNVFYRLYLVVTDSQGSKDTTFRDILPRVVQITLNSNPQGLQILLDGQPFTSPYIFTGVEGIVRTLGVNSPQNFNNQTYEFVNWSQGGSQSQNITTPPADFTYTANFTSTSSLSINPLADAFVRSGSFSNKNYGNNINLTVKKSTSTDGKYFSYLKFDISAIPVTSGSITLRLYGRINNSNNASATTGVYYVANQNWDESLITFNNRPVPQASLITSELISGTLPQYYDFDITQKIIALRSAGINTVTLMLKNLLTTHGCSTVFNSSENSTNPPEIKYFTSLNMNIDKLSLPYISELYANEDLEIFPNPAQNYLNVKLRSKDSEGVLLIIDMNSKIVFQKKTTTNSDISIDISDLKAGNYIVEFNTINNKQQKMLVISK